MKFFGSPVCGVGGGVLWGGGGGGGGRRAKGYVWEKAWSSINLSILSEIQPKQNIVKKQPQTLLAGNSKNKEIFGSSPESYPFFTMSSWVLLMLYIRKSIVH